MTDVAQLGLQIDSRPVNAAVDALNKLGPAASTAAKGADNLASSGAKSETVMRAIEAAAKRSGVSVAEMTARVDANASAQNKLGTASATAVKSMQQISQVAKPAAAATNDLTQSADKGSTSFDKLANTITRRFIAALVVKEVKDFTQYLWGLTAALATTADTADRAGISYAKFQGLTTAGGFKGISSDQFNAGILEFNKQVDLAKDGLGSLQMLLRGNGKTVSDTATTFGIVADMVKSAGKESEKFSILQQAGLPATREFAKLMEQGSGSINKIADASTKLSNQQLEEAKKLNDKWNELWTNFENWGKRAAVNTFSALSGLGSIGAGPQRADGRAPIRVTIPTGSSTPAAPGNPTVDVEKEKAKNALAQQRLGILGSLLTVEQQVQQTELTLAAAGLNLYGVNKKQHDALINLTRAQGDSNLVQNQAAIGVFNFGLATKAAGETLQSWIDRKLLDPKNAEQMAAAHTVLAKSIEQTSNAAQIAAAPLEGLKRLELEAGSVRTQLDQFATTSFSAVTPALRDMMNGTTSLSAGFKNLGFTIVTALQDAIIKFGIVTPIIKAFTSSLNSSGILGFLGIGGGGGAFGAQAAPMSAFPTPFADGGYTGPGARLQPAGVVHKGEFVFSQPAVNRIGVGNLNRLHKGYADGGLVIPAGVSAGGGAMNDNGGGRSVVVTIQQTNTFTNADPGSEARMRQWATQTKNAAVQEAVQQVSKISGTTPGYARNVR